jgi:hypothetical protein
VRPKPARVPLRFRHQCLYSEICDWFAGDYRRFGRSRRRGCRRRGPGCRATTRRRVKGLRREEVASLAGVSIDYYKRLECGNASGVSDSVLEALARALQLRHGR